MGWIVLLIGMLMVIWGLIILLRPLTVPVLIDFFCKGKKRIYNIGVIRIVLGLLLLFSAKATKAYFLIITLGIIIFTAGLLVFFIPQDKIVSFLSYWKEKPSYIFRLLSLLVIAIGFGLVYAAF